MNGTPSGERLPANVELEPGGLAERWLDAVFDGLTGTGSGGRRALAEVEDELSESVREALARGLDRTGAARYAVARFGSPERVARGIRAAHRGSLRPVLTGASLLGAAAVLTVGTVTALTAALQVVIDGLLNPGVCTSVASPNGPENPCGTYGAYHLAAEGCALMGVGLLILGALAVLYPITAECAIAWLPRPRTLRLIAALFALASLYLLGTPYTTVIRQYTEYSFLIPIACAVVATAVGTLIPLWVARHQRRVIDRQVEQAS